MGHLRLVEDLPPDEPFDVVVTNPDRRHANVTYAEVCSFTFTVNEKHPNGIVVMLYENGSTNYHICEPGDSIKGDNGVAVEAVST